MRLADLIGALSRALDITEGQPPGHCVRSCWIGMHIGKHIGLTGRDLWELYYTLLLKDLGCSSNAARICELYLTDDREFKQDFKSVGESLPNMLHFVFSHTGTHAGLGQRLSSVLNILKNGPSIANELIQTRCIRGADIARQLRFPDAVAQGIANLDEHWNGAGKPYQVRGQDIPIYARIALLAQVIDVFHFTSGPAQALAEVRRRAGSWFDPTLVAAIGAVGARTEFWSMLASDEVDRAVAALEPGQFEVALDEDYLDDIAEAFGQVVDSKSPYTSGHSCRVAQYTCSIATQLGMPAPRVRWLRRGALLHDVGKLGVSNTVLDKPDRLDEQEWQAVKRHAAYTQDILCRIEAFSELGRIAAAHHERLDGKGYPLGLHGDDITLETRIITTADIFDALSAKRPYRDAVPVPQTLEMMRENVGTAIDATCLEALTMVLQQEGRLN
jgi:putative nucleotidyltransferase with HDIG domain